MTGPDEQVQTDLRDLLPAEPADLLPWAELDRLLSRRMRARRAVTVVGCVLAVAAIIAGAISLRGGGSARPMPAQPSMVNGPLLFSQHRPTAANRYNNDLATVDRATGRVHLVTAAHSTDTGNTDPVVSADGRSIAYIKDTTSLISKGRYQDHDAVHVVTSTGADDHTIFTCQTVCSGLAWSPDGTMLALSEYDRSIVVINIAGGSRTVCGNICGTDLSQPTWSPDSQHLAFAQGKTFGDPQTPGARIYHSSSIWSVNSDGGQLTQLTNQECSPATESHCMIDTAPTWSPDGEQIAFSRGTTYPEYVGASFPGEPRDTGIDVMSSAGSTVRQVFRCGECEAIMPHWSPSGASLAFFTSAGPRISVTSTALDVVPATGGHSVAVKIPRDHRNEFLVSVTWSPDGTHLAALLSHGYHSHLFTARPDGTAVREVHVGHVRGYDDGTLIWMPKPTS